MNLAVPHHHHAASSRRIAWPLLAALVWGCGHRAPLAVRPTPPAPPPTRVSVLDTRAALGVPTLDLSADSAHQIVVDREPNQYLGHPTTVLLEDGRTMLAVCKKERDPSFCEESQKNRGRA